MTDKVRIKATARTPESTEIRSFWGEIRDRMIEGDASNAQNISSIPDPAMEETLRTDFGRRLRDSLLVGKALDTVSFAFKLEDITHGSAILSIALIGLKGFYDFCEGNPELATTLLETYIPSAFNDTFDLSAYSTRNLSWTYEFDELEAAFEGNQTPLPPSKAPLAKTEGYWKGVIHNINASYLIPYAGAIILLAILYADVLETRKHYNDQYVKTIELQENSLTAERARLLAERELLKEERVRIDKVLERQDTLIQKVLLDLE
ncbi:MAG: hypothetical protein AAFZ17_00730 [Cyanobacteria bacterium J06650_10]